MAADPLVGKVLADRFEVIERIGEGGTGVVYRAKQRPVDKEIAIKVLGAHVSSDPQWVKRFQNEAKVAAKLDHPNTVRFIDFGETKEGLFFIAMELLHGRSLRDEIDKGKMPPQRALRILAQACGSVGEAHSMGIIHRDIKPDNLYLIDSRGPGDFVKVLDFSVAKMETDNMQTRAGIVFGTPQYMSPEQGSGKKLGPQSDIYAFGIVLYEMLSGKPPFESQIPTDVVMMHLRDKPAPIPGLPEPVARIVMRTLEKDPAKRPKTCEDLAAECEAALAELYPTMTPPGLQASHVSTGPHRKAPRPDTGPNVVVTGKPQTGPNPVAGKPVAPAPAVAEARTMLPNEAQAQVVAQAQATAAAVKARAKDGGPRTLMADPSELPQGGGRAAPSAAPELSLPMGPQGTMMLPDSSGVVAFARHEAEAARRSMGQRPTVAAAKAPWFFWAAWVVLGVGAGILVHLYLFQQHLAAHG